MLSQLTVAEGYDTWLKFVFLTAVCLLHRVMGALSKHGRNYVAAIQKGVGLPKIDIYTFVIMVDQARTKRAFSVF